MTIPAPSFPKGRILLTTKGMDSAPWKKILGKTGRDVVLEAHEGIDPTIDYAVLWRYPHGILKRLPNLKLIFSAGAGVDHIMSDPDIHDMHANIPIVRVVAPNLTQHMVEYISWRVLDHHRQAATYREQQKQRLWQEAYQPTADEITVGIMGLGELGTAAANTLRSLGFHIAGWSRTPRTLTGIDCYSGPDGLTPFLNATDILVVLLPHTPETEGVVNYDLLARLRRDGALGGPCLINAGRGPLQKEADILRALDGGILKEASLDVFEHEPLPSESPLWQHPRVFITPHAAATSAASQLAPTMVEQMSAFERGEPLMHLVDRSQGY